MTGLTKHCAFTRCYFSFSTTMLWEIKRSEEPGPLILGECFNWSDGRTFPITPVIVKVKTSFLCGPSAAGVTVRSASTGTCELQRHHRANRINGNQAYHSFCSKPCSLSQWTIHWKQCHWFRRRYCHQILWSETGEGGICIPWETEWDTRWWRSQELINETAAVFWWTQPHILHSQCLQPLCLIVTRSRASVLIGTTNKGESSYFYDLLVASYRLSIYNGMYFKGRCQN